MTDAAEWAADDGVAAGLSEAGNLQPWFGYTGTQNLLVNGHRKIFHISRLIVNLFSFK